MKRAVFAISYLIITGTAVTLGALLLRRLL